MSDAVIIYILKPPLTHPHQTLSPLGEHVLSFARLLSVPGRLWWDVIFGKAGWGVSSALRMLVKRAGPELDKERTDCGGVCVVRGGYCVESVFILDSIDTITSRFESALLWLNKSFIGVLISI